MCDYVLREATEHVRNSDQLSHVLYLLARLLILLLNLASCTNADKSSIPNTAGNSMLNSTEAVRKCWTLLLRHFCTSEVINFLEKDRRTAAVAEKTGKEFGGEGCLGKTEAAFHLDVLCNWVSVAVYQLFLTAPYRSTARLLRQSD